MPRFLIGHFAFPTKAAATAEVRRVLHSAPIDVPLIERDGSLIACLFAMHPRKEGEPVSFHVGLNNYHGTMTRGFQAVFADGTRTSFSYIPCLSPQTDQPNVLLAMRAAIIPSQREAMRAAYNGRALLVCALRLATDCTQTVPLAEAHAHHKFPKFRDIADHFLSLIGEPPTINSEAFGDDFADAVIKRRWVVFHDSIAQRVVVCAACNAEDERRDRQSTEG